MNGSRFRRRLRYHLWILLGALAGGMCLALAYDRPDLRNRLSAGSAYVALTCVALSLILGPLNLLRARPNPVSSDLRRDLGIWGGVVGLVHVGVGLTIHMHGKMLQYFLAAPESRGVLPIRIDVFGAANDLGLASAIVLLLLVLLSSDFSLRRLGTARWKFWQRMNYLGAIALVGHGLLYQFIEHRHLPFVLLLCVAIGITLAFQFAGVRMVRLRAR